MTSYIYGFDAFWYVDTNTIKMGPGRKKSQTIINVVMLTNDVCLKDEDIPPGTALYIFVDNTVETSAREQAKSYMKDYLLEIGCERLADRVSDATPYDYSKRHTCMGTSYPLPEWYNKFVFEAKRND